MERRSSPLYYIALLLISAIIASLAPVRAGFAAPAQPMASQPFQPSTESNIASGKPVSIVTNGANESRSGAGQNPMDVTDSSLAYEPASALREDGVVGYVNDTYGELMRVYVTIDLGAEYDISTILFNTGDVQFGDHWRPDRMISPLQNTTTTAGGSFRGAWTEHRGTLRASSVTIEFRKTRNTVYQDWLFLGEIEIYGKPVQAPYLYTPFCYNNYCNEKLSLYPVQGRNIALLLDSPDNNIFILDEIVTAIDAAYDYYQTATGRHPTPLYQYNGLGTIAVVPQTCGAGCGYLGYTGIELQTDFWNLLYSGVASRSEFDQTVFYELGRNFWFYEGQLEYKQGDSTGSVTTGYAVFMRFMSMDAAGVKGAPFNGHSFAKFRSEVEQMLDRYLADSSLNWANTLKLGRAPANPLNLGATDLFASFLLKLHGQYGDQFVSAFWKEAGKRPTASTTQDAVDNFIVAASYAANENLADLFVNEWRWPLSIEARNELAQHFSPPTTEGIVLSSNRNGRLPGIGNFKDEDILLYTPSNNSWQMLLDGSDVGLQTNDVDAFTFLPNGNLLLSVERDFKLNGAFTTSGSPLTVDDADVLEFIPTLLGGTTRGKFRLYLDGSTVQLDTSAEDIDALFLNQGNMLLISVLGKLKTKEWTGADEDIFRYHDDRNAWVEFFDGSDVKLSAGSENIVAAHKTSDQFYFSTKGNYQIQSQNALKGITGDIVLCTLVNGGSQCNFGLFWRGRDHGLGKSMVDALYIGTLPTGVTLSATDVNEVDAAVSAADDDTDEPDELDGFEEEEAIRVYLPVVTR